MSSKTISFVNDPIEWFNTEILLWAIIEWCIGLVCACLPCMTPLTRLVTIGPVAEFRSKKASTATVEVNTRPWPGGRRLPSIEDSRVVLSGDNNELNEWPHPSQIPSNTSGDNSPERQWNPASLVSSSGVEASLSNSIAPAVEVPKKAIHVEKGWHVEDS